MILYTNKWMKSVAKELVKDAVCVEVSDPKFPEYLKEAEAIFGLGLKADKAFLDAAPKLKVISLTAVGYDGCDLNLIKERGIVLTNTPQVLNETTADLAFGLLMSTARRIPEAQEWMKTGNWKGGVTEEIFGTDVHGKRLGLIGLGGIGQAIAKRGHFGFDMEISYHTRTKKTDLPFPATHMGLDELLKTSDFVMVILPLSSDTKGLIGKRELGLMKKDAILINAARGPIVDEVALYEALKDKTIKAAGLDVFELEPLPMTSKLYELKNVVLTPHIGSATDATRAGMVRVAAENLLAALRHETPKNLVLK